MSRAPSSGSDGGAAAPQDQRGIKEKVTSEQAFPREESGALLAARKLVDLLGAKKGQWHPRKKCWEKVADHNVQLAALREIAKILGMYQSDDGCAPRIIDISTIPMRRKRVLDSEDPLYGNIGCDGRERSER